MEKSRLDFNKTKAGILLVVTEVMKRISSPWSTVTGERS